jgi:hypothetical protein
VVPSGALEAFLRMPRVTSRLIGSGRIAGLGERERFADPGARVVFDVETRGLNDASACAACPVASSAWPRATSATAPYSGPYNRRRSICASSWLNSAIAYACRPRADSSAPSSQ